MSGPAGNTTPRRQWLASAGGVGLLAALGGGWWRHASEARLQQDTAGLWLAAFPQPGGGELQMGALRGRPLVLNFWATWCPPCVKEMPELDRFAREFGTPAKGGWNVVGIAIDAPTPVREFLTRSPVAYPIAMAGFGGTELARHLGNSKGGLPFTVLFNRSGAAVESKMGETHFAELAAWARKHQR